MSGIDVGDIVEWPDGTCAIVEKVNADNHMFAWGLYPYKWTSIDEVKLRKSNKNRQQEAYAKN